MEPSVFLTPPSSLEKEESDAGYSSWSRAAPSFSLLSPAPERDDRIEPVLVDIVSIAADKFPHVATKIFSYLHPADLCSSLRVCRTWRKLVIYNGHFRWKVKEFQREKQVNKENVLKRVQLINTTKAGLTSRSTNPTLKPATMNFTGTNVSLRPCPSCNSPARKTGLSQAICCNCNYDFCTQCFKPSHHKEECTQRRRLDHSSNLAACKKSKKRLKRL